MFDLGASELLLIVIVAIVVIGPKDLPLALRTAGRWIGKMRRMSAHFRTGLDTMIREAEMAEMETKWAEQNARIMASDPATHPTEMEPTGALPPVLSQPAPPQAALPSPAAPAALPAPGASSEPVAEASPVWTPSAAPIEETPLTTSAEVTPTVPVHDAIPANPATVPPRPDQA